MERKPPGVLKVLSLGRNALNETACPVRLDRRDGDLLLIHSHDTIVQARTAYGLLLDAFDGSDPHGFLRAVQSQSPSIAWRVLQAFYFPKTNIKKRRVMREFDAVRVIEMRIPCRVLWAYRQGIAEVDDA